MLRGSGENSLESSRQQPVTSSKKYLAREGDVYIKRKIYRHPRRGGGGEHSTFR